MPKFIDESVKYAAAKWHLKLIDDSADDSVRSEFEAWLLADPLHTKAYKLVQDTMGDFDSVDKLIKLDSAVSQKKLFDKSQRQKKITKYGSAFVVSFLMLGLSWLVHQQYQLWQAKPTMQLVQSSSTAQILTRILDDGTNITLNADTQLEVTYYRHARHIHLTRGEAIFDVARDPSRPFVVETQHSKVTVLGTRFVVNKLTNLVRVSVDHGRVQVESGHAQASPIVLQDGQVAEVKNNQWPHLVDKRAEDAFTFKDGAVNFDRADMQEVAETLSRYVKPSVVADIDQESSLRVSALFKTNEAYRFIQTLPEFVPVEIQSSPTQIVIKPKK